MNIGVDIRALTPEKRSGVGSYIFEALKNIIKLDHENQYYLLNSGFKNKFVLPPELQAPNVHLVHIKISNKLINFALFFNLIKDIAKFFPVSLDLFWMPNINFVKLDEKIPLILTIHDLSFLHSKNFYSLKRKYWHTFVNVKFLVERSKSIIAVSQNTQRDIMRFFTVNEEKIKIIYPGLQYQTMTVERAKEIVKNLNIADNFFLFLGTLEPRKNINSIIQAFDQYHCEYPKAELVLVGNKGWLYQRLLWAIKKRPYIKYFGFLDGDIKDALYCLSQAFIWPSFYEGFGFPPLEATMHGRPVITSYKTSLPEIMQKQALYVDPYNSAEIYQLLKALTEDDDLKVKMIQKAKEFSFVAWPQQAQTIINLFKKCV